MSDFPTLKDMEEYLKYFKAKDDGSHSDIIRLMEEKINEIRLLEEILRQRKRYESGY